MKKLPELQKKEKILPEMPNKKSTIFTIDANPEMPQFPDVKKQELDFKYPLLKPYAYAHIYWDKKLKELIYAVEEPELNSEEKKTLILLEDGIKELINISYLSLTKSEKIIEYLEKNIKVLLNELRVVPSKESFLKLMYYIYRDFVGMGKIEPLLNDYFIEDIECNGAVYPLYVVHRKYRNIKTNVVYENIPELAKFVEKLAQKTGKYVSYATPLLDGALPDGSRVNATYTEDISSRGPTFTIRKFTKNPWPPTQLMKFGTISPSILAYLWLTVEHGKNIMVIGGTGSGKTTLLNALTFFIPPQARIVSIEDTRELNLEHANWLPSVSREGVGLANLVGQKYGEVTMFNLLKESFRQNPDYVIVGEIRGEEAYVLFQGMASGHPSFGTMHADSVDTMVKRLETPPINLSSSLVEVIDVVLSMISTKRSGKSVRRLKDVNEVISIGEKGGANTINQPFVWNPTTDKYDYVVESDIFKKLVRQQGLSESEIVEEWRKRTMLLIAMYEKEIFDFHEVQMIISDYYKSPKEVLLKFGIR
jgi:archaeal flagellar protein FlaI